MICTRWAKGSSRAPTASERVWLFLRAANGCARAHILPVQRDRLRRPRLESARHMQSGSA